MRVWERFCGGHFSGDGISPGVTTAEIAHHSNVYPELKQGYEKKKERYPYGF